MKDTNITKGGNLQLSSWTKGEKMPLVVSYREGNKNGVLKKIKLDGNFENNNSLKEEIKKEKQLKCKILIVSKRRTKK